MDIAHGPREEDLDLVEAFVESTGPSRSEETCAVLLLALDVVVDRARMLEGGWITTAVTHVHTHYRGGGFGALKTIDLIERFFRWIHEKGWLDDYDYERLLAKADDARTCVGGARRRPATFIEPCHDRDIEQLTQRFVAEGELSPFARELAPQAIRVLKTYVTSDGGPLLFGRLQPALQAPWMVAEPQSPNDLEADRQLCAIWACFYRWLGATGQLAPERATRLERELLRLALAPAAQEA